jgi:hypothetical protein
VTLWPKVLEVGRTEAFVVVVAGVTVRLVVLDDPLKLFEKFEFQKPL